MGEKEPFRYTPRQLPRFTVIRLDDGRVGSLENKKMDRPFVIVKGGTGVQVRANDKFEVVAFPAETARVFVENYQDASPKICPICGGELFIDVEYMQNNFGPEWEHVTWRDWSFYCQGCGEAGLWAEFEMLAKEED